MTIKRWGLLLAVLGAGLLLLHVIGVKEAFTAEDVSALAARVSALRTSTSVDETDAEAEENDDDEDPERNVEPRDPDEPEEIDAEMGGIALALREAKPDVFARLVQHFDSADAHDLDALETELAPFCVGVTE